jgi:hypothetical protein
MQGPLHSRIGTLTSTPLDGGPVTTTDLVRCVHCGYCWLFVKGSGRRRGFCTRCNGLCCGRRECVERGCCHWRQQLDNLEARRPLGHRPIVVCVEGEVPQG